jgi:TRAP-type C4-dicarboxylate transport system permease small subunit
MINDKAARSGCPDDVNRISTWSKKTGEAALGSGLAVMVAMVFGNVVLRYLFDTGITVSEEVSRFIFVWLTFGGAILVFAEGGHIAMDNLTARLPEAVRRGIATLSCLVMLGCCGLMVVGGWRQTVINLGNVAPVSGIPKGAIYASAVAAGACIAALCLRNLWRLTRGASADSVAQHAQAE